jgi:hydroxyacylglutathione hydrolase
MSQQADQLVDFHTGAPIPGSLDVAWIHGARSKRRATDPPIQVHHYDEHTVILRQSKAVHYEAPFMFLLFGNERALLLDTGATAQADRFPLRSTVDGLIDTWLAAHPRTDYGLVVAHTHGHGDHIAADAQFADRPRTTVVPPDLEAVQAFFGLDPDRWPGEQTTLDLGGRVLTVLAGPGHHRAAVVLHDPWTGILFTGDTVLPARLYAFDFPAFTATLDRLTAFADTHPVTHILGCHIEMTTRPGRDYPLGTRHQPDERPLQMTVAQLHGVRDAAHAIAAGGRKGVHVHDDFIIYNEPGTKVLARLVARGWLGKIRAVAAAWR